MKSILTIFGKADLRNRESQEMVKQCNEKCGGSFRTTTKGIVNRELVCICDEF